MKKVLLLILFISLSAFAVRDDDCRGDPHHCEGPPGPAGPPGKDGEDGRDGVDGKDGADGRDGIDGKDGVDGSDGADGRDGIDGVDGQVPTEWITNTNNTFNIHNKWIQSYREAAAAEAAMQIYLPRDQNSRITFGVSRMNGMSGYALGYAYMLDNDRNTALTFAVGVAGDETAAKASFGFEFGGTGRMEMPAIVTVPVVAPPQPEPEPVGNVSIPEHEYHDLLLAQVQQEELDDVIKMAEYRYVQQQSLIQSLEKEHENDNEEIKALKVVVSEALKKRDERQAVEDQKTASFAAIYSKYAKQEEEPDDEGSAE